MTATTLRSDQEAILSLLPEGARVLDVGCGSGELMRAMAERKSATCRGLEIDAEKVTTCLANGLSVVQGNADRDLAMYGASTFDVAILSKTIQEMRRPAHVLKELSRVASTVLVSFRNYGHWKRRFDFLTSGRMPTGLNREWYEAESLHPCTSLDFAALCETLNLPVTAVISVSESRLSKAHARASNWLDLRSEDVVFRLERSND